MRKTGFVQRQTERDTTGNQPQYVPGNFLQVFFVDDAVTENIATGINATVYEFMPCSDPINHKMMVSAKVTYTSMALGVLRNLPLMLSSIWVCSALYIKPIRNHASVIRMMTNGTPKAIH